MKEKLHEVAASRPVIGDVRGMGLLLGLELVRDKETKESFPASTALAEKVRETAMNELDEGLLLYTGVGRTADITPRDYLIIAPPFIIKDKEMDLLADLLAGAVDKACENLDDN